MKVTLKVPDEIPVRAKARRLWVEEYLEKILKQQLGTQTASKDRLRTPAEIRAWLDSLAQFSDEIPPLPDKISRERTYQEHD